jgi:DNA-directed RNA polymerase specialized sigma24 family protein
MQRDGLTVEETAQRFSVTVRTVFRAMQRCREVVPGMEALPLAA